MAQNTPGEKTHWRIARCFEGTRTPEDLLKALIRAHRA
ncbi:Uncharacterised protein [Fusobacterium naviforme]|nr:Uncharacterised protein [Fusobacterium naviforme]